MWGVYGLMEGSVHGMCVEESVGRVYIEGLSDVCGEEYGMCGGGLWMCGVGDMWNVRCVWREVWDVWKGVWDVWRGVWDVWRGVWDVWRGVWDVWRGVWDVWRGLWMCGVGDVECQMCVEGV